MNLKKVFDSKSIVDKQIYETVIDEYEQYIGLKSAINNKIQKQLQKNRIPDDRNLPIDIENDLSIINTIANAEEDGMLDCLTDNMVHYLTEAIIELEKYQGTLPKPDSQIQTCIKYAKLTLEDLPRTTLHKI